MKELVFKYFDTFCYGELIADEIDPGWTKPTIDNQSFGYATENNYLFYNGSLEDIFDSMFGVGRTKFREYFTEWFEGRYNLPVSYVV